MSNICSYNDSTINVGNNEDLYKEVTYLGNGGKHHNNIDMDSIKQKIFVLFIISAIIITGHAQTTPKGTTDKPSTKDTIGFANSSLFILDLNKLEIRSEEEYWNIPNKRNVPFDVPFLLKLDNINDTLKIDTLYFDLIKIKNYNELWGKTKQRNCKNTKFVNKDTLLKAGRYWKNYLAKKPDVVINIPPLKANANYRIAFYSKSKPNETQIKIFTNDALTMLYKTLLSNYTLLMNQTDTSQLDSTLDLLIKSKIKTILNKPFSDLKSPNNKNVIINPEGQSTYDSEWKQIQLITSQIKKSLINIYKNLYRVINDNDLANFTNGIKNKDTIKIKENTNTNIIELKKIFPNMISRRFQGIVGTSNLKNYINDSTSLLFDTSYLRLMIANLENYEVGISKIDKNNTDSVITKAKYVLSERVKYLKQLDNEIVELKKIVFESKLKVLVKQQFTNYLIIDINTLSTFKIRAKWYFCPDVGIAVVVNTGIGARIVPYYGLNFSFLPINREAHYSLFSMKNRVTPDCSLLYRFGQSLSFVAGVTMLSTENYMDDKWRGVIGNYGMVTGLGLRLNDFLRVCGGVIWMKLKDENPTINTMKLSAPFFFSLSLDLDVVGYIERIAENVKLNKL